MSVLPLLLKLSPVCLVSPSNITSFYSKSSIMSEPRVDGGFSPNPYNFVNPVSDEQKFADREDELKEIRYYLSQAEADSYYHIGIVGSRAAGKSSLLNRIEQVSRDDNHLPVKISLNSQIVQDQLGFFKELLDSIMAEGSKHDVIGDSLLESFREKVESLNPDVEASLGYSSTYIRAKQSQESQPDIPQRVLIEDLEDLYGKVEDSGKRSIVLLLDEADLLAENDAILQKLRNVFSEIDGFNLVLSGTEGLFDRTDDVFSPMSRSFKRISLEPFEEPEKTRECIEKPLSKEEIEDLDDQCIGEIHRITGGSPYEINLVAHHMYKKYQEGGSEIALTPEVLDNVAEELDRIRQSGHHKISDEIKRMMPNKLQVLISLLEFPNVPKDWLVEFSLLDQVETLEPDTLSSSKNVKRHIVEDLVEQGIIEEGEEENLAFAGSAFDRAYLKYYAAAQDVIDDVSEFHPGMMGVPAQNLYQKLVEHVILTEEFSEYRVHTAFDRGAEPKEMDIGEGRQLFVVSAHITIPAGETRTVIEFSPDEREKFYQDLPNATRFRCNIEWMDQGFVSQVRFIDDGEKQAERLEQRIDTIKDRLDYLGYELLLEEEIQFYSQAVDASEKRGFEEAIQLYQEAIEINPSFSRAWANKGLMHQNIGSIDEALNCYDKALELRPNWGEVLKQKGILLIDVGRFEDALSLLIRATEEEQGDWNIWHNKGRALLELEQFEEAVEAFERAEMLNREVPIPTYGKVLAYLNLDRFSDAVDPLESLLEGDYSDLPPESELKHHYAVALANTGDHEEALEYYRDVVEEDPRNHQAWYNKAMTELELDMGKEASQSLDNSGINDLLQSDLPDISGSEIEELPLPIDLEKDNEEE